MLTIEYTGQFKKDLKLVKRRGKQLKKLEQITIDICHEKPLSKTLRDHFLQGDWVNYRECHIEPDWLLIYKVLKKESVVIFVRTGTHSDLF